MRKREIVKEFGESYVAQTMLNLGYEVDRLDAEGIDLAAYKDEKKYGISVKSRCIQHNKNDSVNLNYNDICYTYLQSVKRGVIPAYAFIIHSNERIDLLVVTQEYVFKHYLGVESIEKYMQTYESKKDSGSTKSISTSLNSRENWSKQDADAGVIFAAKLLSWTD